MTRVCQPRRYVSMVASARAMAVDTSAAAPAMASPASVSRTPLPDFSTRTTPSSSCRVFSCWETAEGVTFMASAVAPTVPRSASSRRIRSRLKSMSRGYTAGRAGEDLREAGQPARPGRNVKHRQPCLMGAIRTERLCYGLDRLARRHHRGRGCGVVAAQPQQEPPRHTIPHPPGRPAPAMLPELPTVRRRRRRQAQAAAGSTGCRRGGGWPGRPWRRRGRPRRPRRQAPRHPRRPQACRRPGRLQACRPPSRPQGRPPTAAPESSLAADNVRVGDPVVRDRRAGRYAYRRGPPRAGPRGTCGRGGSRSSGDSSAGRAGGRSRPPPRIHRAPRADPARRGIGSRGTGRRRSGAAPASSPGAGEPTGHLATEQPYGEGSAAPAADGSGPEGFTVKGNASSMIYHDETSPAYEETRAEVWFASPAHAEAAGFRPPRRTRQ